MILIEKLKNKKIDDSIMADIIYYLTLAKQDSKFVFAINYTEDGIKADEFLHLCNFYGFIPYLGPVELNLVE